MTSISVAANEMKRCKLFRMGKAPDGDAEVNRCQSFERGMAWLASLATTAFS